MIEPLDDNLKESDFSYHKLDQYFWTKGLRKSCDAMIDGIKVTKTLTPYRSNSRRSTEFSVTYAWTGSDGVRKVAKKTSRFEANRSNDPSRNWGGHE